MTNERFFFVQITDTHLGDRASFKRTEQVIDGIKQLPFPIECVIHTGDVMDGNPLDRAKVTAGQKLFDRLDIPVHFLPGNHDIVFGDRRVLETAFTNHFGELSSSAHYHGVTFLFLNTEELALASLTDVRENLALLERELEQTAGKPVILFQHTPSVETFYGYTLMGGYREDVRVAWRELLAKYQVKAVIAGHHHRDQHHWIGDIPLYVSSCVFAYRGRQASFRVYEYNNGRVSYWTLYLEPSKSLLRRVRNRAHKYVRRIAGVASAPFAGSAARGQ